MTKEERKQKREQKAREKAAKAAAKKNRQKTAKKNTGNSMLSKMEVHVNHPKRTQDLVSMLFDEFDKDTGIFQKNGTYSKMYTFTDVSFANAQLEDQVSIFKKWVEMLHSFNERTHLQILVASVPVRKDTFQKDFMYNENFDSDSLNELRDEFNRIIKKTARMDEKESLMTQRYLVLSMKANGFKEARDEFLTADIKLEKKFDEMGSKIRPCSYEERLEFVYNQYKGKKLIEDTTLPVDEFAEKNGISIYDQLAPSMADFSSKDYFQIGNGGKIKYMRVIYVSKLSTSITPRFFNELMNLNGMDVTVSCGITPIATAKAIRTVEKQLASMKTERLDKIKRASKEGYSYEAVKDEKLEDSINDALVLKADIQKNSQKLFANNLLVLVKGDTLEELENNTLKIMDMAAEQVITVSYLNFQQVEGLEQVMPFACNEIQLQRSLTSEATACNLPFNAKDLMHKNSIYYGMNLTSKNAVFADRKKLINGNGCVLATSGAGKSFAVKMMIEQIYMRYPKDDIIVIDPQHEYGPLIKRLDGQEIDISTSADTHINPFDLDKNYDDKSPVKAKAEYISAFFDTIVTGGLDGVQKSIIDRCTLNVFEKYEASGFKDESLLPSLPGFYEVLRNQPEREAMMLAIALERYVKGSTDIFSKRTNVNINNRFVCFDISQLPESLQTTGYLVILDHIKNTLAHNRDKGINTWIFIDEFHVLLANQFSAQYVAKIYKEGRKMGALPTIITQNITDVLNNEQGNKILSNSEFALILKQKALDIRKVAAIFSISDGEAEYIGPDCPKGQGVLVYSNDRVVFRNVVPKGSILYDINNTDLIVQAR